jgi:hypothetical protein
MVFEARYYFLTANVSEPDPTTPKPARIECFRSGSLTLAVRSLLRHAVGKR